MRRLARCRYVHIRPGSFSLSREVEQAATGVVLIDVDLEPVELSPSLHWRVGTWDKPPVDVRLDEDGALRAIQVVLQDERVPDSKPESPPVTGAGLPIFATTGWDGDRYRDETREVALARAADRDLLVSFGAGGPARTAVRVAAELTLGFDAASGLCEIWLGALTAQEWATIESAGP